MTDKELDKLRLKSTTTSIANLVGTAESANEYLT